MKQKFSESVAHVMEYIKFSEMGGEIDETDPYHPMYLGLKELLYKVKDEEEILDEDTQTILRDEDKAERYYHHPDEVANRKWAQAYYDADQETLKHD